MLSGKLRAATGGAVGESWTFAENLSQNLTTWGPGGQYNAFPFFPEFFGSYGSELGIIGLQGGLSTTSDSGATWLYWPDSPINANYQAIGTNGSEWVIGQYSGSALWYSTDKITWTNYYSYLLSAGWPANLNTNSIIWDGTNWVLMTNGGWTAKSPNMTTWTVSNSLQVICSARSATVNNIIFQNGLYVASGDGRNLNGRIICTSPDGLTWTERLYAANFGIQNVVWTGLQFVAIDYSGLAYTSPTGVTWTSNTGLQTAAYSSPVTNQYAKLLFDGTNLVVITQRSDIATSTNGTSWTANNSLKTNTTWNLNLLTLAYYTGSKFLIFGVKGSQPVIYAESTDLTTWTFPQTFNNFTTTYGRRNANNITWTGSQYILSAQNGGNIATSPNGINWTNQLGLYNNPDYNEGFPGTAGAYYGFAYGANKLAIIRSGTVPRKMFTTSDGVTWTYQPNYSTTYASNGSPTYDGLHFAGNKFYASFDNNTYGVSLDTVTWSSVQPAIWAGSYITEVLWSGSIYLAFGSNYKSATSTDGLTWTNQPNTVTNSIQGIGNYGYSFWDGSQFVTFSGGLIWTSANGVTWVSNSGLTNAATTLNKGSVVLLAWCGTFCIAITNQAAVLKSYDYTTWTSSLELQTTDWYKYFASNWGPTAGVWNGSQLAICGAYGKLAIST